MSIHITFRQLEIFACVAKQLSITRAAEFLHLSQPAVSMQIKQIEHLISMPLLEKNGKKLILTQAGIILRDYADNILASHNVLEQQLAKLAGAEEGHLNLVVPETANQFITLVLAQFIKLHPGISFHLGIHNREELLESLKDHTTDLAIMGQVPLELDLVTKAFMKNPLVIIAPPDHPLCRKQKISLHELMTNKFVVRERGSGTRIAMQRFFGGHGMHLKTSMEMPSNEAIKQAVAAGLGLGIISMHTLQQELALKQITILHVEKMPILRNWYLVHQKKKILSPAMALFIQFVTQNTQKIWSSKYPELSSFL